VLRISYFVIIIKVDKGDNNKLNGELKMKTLSQNKKALETALENAHYNELEAKIVAMPFDNMDNSLDQLIKTQVVEVTKYSDCSTTPSKIAKELIKSVMNQDNTEEVDEIVVSVTIDDNDTEWFLTVTA